MLHNWPEIQTEDDDDHQPCGTYKYYNEEILMIVKILTNTNCYGSHKQVHYLWFKPLQIMVSEKYPDIKLYSVIPSNIINVCHKKG